MAKRVVIQGGGASPIRVSAAGVSVDGAEFNDLIFDGNQSPLRIAPSGLGYVEVPVIDRKDDSFMTIKKQITSVPIPAVPTGTTPLFLVAWRQRDDINALATPRYPSGGGGSISNVDGAGLRFVALNFVVRQTYMPERPPNIINYCIFSNAQ